MAVSWNSYNNEAGYPDEIRNAIRLIRSTYQQEVRSKDKSLLKFGRTSNADNGVLTTIGAFQGAEVNETFATGNSVDSIVSSSADDTEVVKIEGHTIDASGNLTFVIQEATLTGQTPALLTTPLARVSRLFNNNKTFASPAADLVGNVAVYDSTVATTAPSGVPSDATATKIYLLAGNQQSEKCATSFSSVDYFLLTSVTASIEKASGSTSTADIDLYKRELGGVFRPMGLEISLRSAAYTTASQTFFPGIVIPPNTDLVMKGTSTVDNTFLSANFNGFILTLEG